MNKQGFGKFLEHVSFIILMLLEPKHAFLGMFTSFSSITNVSLLIYQ